MRLDAWVELDDRTYDRALLPDLTSLRFTEAGNGVLVLGPAGAGRTLSRPRSGTSPSAAA